MRPAQQGAFDGLCGVYAIINSLDLVGLKQPRSILHRQLFLELTHGLGAAALLRAMHIGLDGDDLIRGAEVAFRWLAQELEVHLVIAQPFAQTDHDSMDVFVGDVRKYANERDTAVIVQARINGDWHWTVTKAVTRTQMRLRDSRGRKELDIKSFGLSSGSNSFDPAETLVISRK